MLVFGFDPRSSRTQRFVMVAGRARHATTRPLVGDRAAKSMRSAGDVSRSRARRFPVVGVFHSGDRFVDNGVVLPLPTVQALAGRPREVTTIGDHREARLAPRRGRREAIERRFGGVTAVTEPGQAVKVDTSSRLIISSRLDRRRCSR